MRIVFLINQTHKEEAVYTTTLLAFRAHELGHTIMYVGVADFAYLGEKKVGAHCRAIDAAETVLDQEDLLKKLREKEKVFVAAEEMDVLWLRFDPVLDMNSRPWASTSALQFAQLIKRKGTLVINDPDTLIEATNKLYLENFPKKIRPKTIVTRNYDDVVNFMGQHKDQIILKPLKGSGGKNVFLVKKDERHNLKQIVEGIARDGYVLAQEYLPEAKKGDIRFFLLNGKPLEENGTYAGINRVQPEGEIRSNIHQGAKAKQIEINEGILKTVKQVSDKLKEDGMYFVGLDIVGDKIMEINVFTPGGLGHASELCDTDFATMVINDLEQLIKKRKQS